jgi:transcription initiation factor IIE alpha subunit
MADNEIKAVCKRCGRQSPASQFVLDPVYGMMVCPLCIKERRSKTAAFVIRQDKRSAGAKKEELIKDRPAGWDKEDDYLERAYARKKQAQPHVAIERVDSSHVNYTCPKCKYRFLYDTERKHPRVCPYCNSQIYTFRF